MVAEAAGEGVEVDIISTAVERGDCITQVVRLITLIKQFNFKPLMGGNNGGGGGGGGGGGCFYFQEANSRQSRLLTV